MKKNIIWLIVGGVAVALLLLAVIRRREQPQESQRATTSTAVTRHPLAPMQSPAATQIPAHYETAPPLSNLATTLAPEKFSGKAREAYQAVKDAPQLVAQMPCYCHCDRSLGHKSLHSCLEDDHAANCATCIGEALIAYQLQKRGLPAQQICEQVIAQFGD